MTIQETARHAFENSTSGVLVLEDVHGDEARIRFDAIRSYRDNNGEFSITVATSDDQKAYHSDQIREIHLDASNRTENPAP